jgi:hypothetical protein
VAEELMIYNLDLDSKMVIYMPSKKYGNIMVFMLLIVIYDKKNYYKAFPTQC